MFRLKKKIDGLLEFEMYPLNDIVVLTGANGSGKSRLLKLLERYINNSKNIKDGTVEIHIQKDNGSSNDIILSSENIDKIKIVNYSHFDANLQLPDKFSPYVISKARTVLQSCNYEETALNALLLLYDMAFGYSEEFKDGKDFEKVKSSIDELCSIDIEIQNELHNLKFCTQKIDEMALSPGQQYLLRIAIACFCNKTQDNMIFFLDEPELHLHPKALIECIKQLKNHFHDNQFWISTHSLPLIAYLKDEMNANVFVMNNGKPEQLRSDQTHLLTNLMGSEDNISSIRNLLSEPYEYASNRFSIECFNPAGVADVKKNDPQNKMIETFLEEGDIVVDYGAGKGRLFEGIGMDCLSNKLSEKIIYYAYDESDEYAPKCKSVMERYGGNPQNYFNDIDKLCEKVRGTAKYVMLINVLHEIDTTLWEKVFGNIKTLLKDDGSLIIVERAELTIGEAPYKNRFLVITPEAAKVLFGQSNVACVTHPQRQSIIKYSIIKEGLDKINIDVVYSCITRIQDDAFHEIKGLKSKGNSKDFRLGLKSSFWLNQYANAVISAEEILTMKGKICNEGA